MKKLKLSGCFTAIITPFNRDNTVDYKALENLVEWQIQSGISGIVPCGTTGESVALTDEEYDKVIRTVVNKVNGRILVIAGAGGNNTQKTVDLAKRVAQTGADAILSVCPYYNKPNQEGLFQHFTQIADQIDIPVVLYNVPGRTVVNLEAKTTLRLAAHPNIIGIKEASGDLIQIMEIIKDRAADFSVLSGDDQLTLPMIACGGNGVISVIANQMPRRFSNLINFALAGKFEEARSIQNKLLDLMNFNFSSPNPIPVKTSLALKGMIQEVFRLPLTNMNEKQKESLVEHLNKVDFF